MKRAGGYPKPQMTRAGNALAFTMWLSGATDDALAGANVASLARSYGLKEQDVQAAITRQQFARSIAA
jgi:hypothetical protein